MGKRLTAFGVLAVAILFCTSFVSAQETPTSAEQSLSDLEREEMELTKKLYELTKRKLEVLEGLLQHMGNESVASPPPPSSSPTYEGAPLTTPIAPPPPSDIVEQTPSPPPVPMTPAALEVDTTLPEGGDSRSEPVDMVYAPAATTEPAAETTQVSTEQVASIPAAATPLPPAPPQPLWMQQMPSTPPSGWKSDLPSGWEAPPVVPEGHVSLDAVRSPYGTWQPAAPAEAVPATTTTEPVPSPPPTTQ